jgi:hypothetical protein
MGNQHEQNAKDFNCMNGQRLIMGTNFGTCSKQMNLFFYATILVIIQI